eukprot:SAG31_NODE_853_length_11512_cov_42.663279_11_plen_182_part_00
MLYCQDDWFGSRMGLLFDPLALAETVAGLTFDYLLDLERATRLHTQNPISVFDPARPPSLAALLDTILRSVIPREVNPRTGTSCVGQPNLTNLPAGQIPLLVAHVFADRLLSLHDAASFRIKWVVAAAVEEARSAAAGQEVSCRDVGELDTSANWGALVALLANGKPFITDKLKVPMGAPI